MEEVEKTKFSGSRQSVKQSRESLRGAMAGLIYSLKKVRRHPYFAADSRNIWRTTESVKFI